MPALPRAIGDRGESLARDYLTQQGYMFITANWSCKAGEIDLIMQAGDTRVFVEVRLRRPTSYGAGADTVAWQKQQKLRKAAAWYMQTQDYWGNTRFDVISITDNQDTAPEIEHIPDAF